PCGGIVTIHSQTGEITRSGMYWALAHYSRAIRKNARRIDSEAERRSGLLGPLALDQLPLVAGSSSARSRWSSRVLVFV
ncbi:hypothetical protein, partial [Lentzea sp.]|uniref:hypothetical protein n=1 Tax=Lentzea sp. TaxID=56099 RepID=UPI002ED4D0F0